MRARRLTPGLWLAVLVSSAMVAGCGLTLDYGPPDMDAARGDANVQQSCATGCDDGLRCTADTCMSDACVHTDLCPGNTDCVDRSRGGECRRACTHDQECEDQIGCTRDFCAADGHCAHQSTCDGGRPVCLESGVCAPDHCSNDDDCSDHDLCSGTERCVSGTCHAGTIVGCDPGSGCMTRECDPATGTCGPVLHADMCGDPFACTADACNADGSCTHTPDHAMCISTNRCMPRSCNPTAAGADAMGCVGSGGVACPMACGATILCVPATGLCDFATACPSGQVCRSDGCHLAGTCSTDADCTGIRGPGGCATFCVSHTCQPLMCPPPLPGSCAMRTNDGTGCPSGHCYDPAPALCADGDDLSIDTCDPSSFVCNHTCPAASPNDCVTYAYVGGRCVPSFDATVCTRLHPAGTGAGCARYACLGHDAASGSGPDGCALVGSNSACNDLAACTDDTCTISPASGVGTCHHDPRSDVDTFCSDGVDCTVDGCTPGAAGDVLGCSHTPMDAICAMAAGPLACATTTCVRGGAPPVHIGGTTLPSGCTMTYMPGHCTGAPICTLDGQCTLVPCGMGTSTRCDDGTGCNGTEVCNVVAGHCTQVPLVTLCMAASGT